MKKDLKKLEDTQKKIGKAVVTRDGFKLKDIKTIAGFDIAYDKDKAYCTGTILNYKTMEVIEKKYYIEKKLFPYIHGKLMFREGPPIIETYKLFENKPDLVMVQSGGLLHPLRAGLASYIGVSLNAATIGVSTKLMWGEVREGKIYLEKDFVGVRLETKKGSNPLFISPGHKIAIGTAMKIVKECMRGNHKLPEPIRLAHKYSTKIRSKYRKEEK